jgi:tetratricopeptide (TPR) repeat protein
MHALPLALLLAAAPAEVAPGPAVAPIPVAAPAPQALAAPALVGPETSNAPETSTAPATSNGGAAPATPPAPKLPPPLPQAAVEKLGQGDRASLAGDWRNALFAYQDAVYLAPQSPLARVKLGRAYLALRYPAQAIAQAELALAADPSNVEARRLADDARNPPPRPASPPSSGAAAANGVSAAPAPASGLSAAQAPASPGAWPAPAPTTPAQASAAQPSSGAPAPRVFRFTEGDGVAAPPERAPSSAAPDRPAAPAPAAQPAAATSPAAPASRTIAAVAEVEAARGTAASSAPSAPAAQLYRAALVHLGNREFEKGAAALTEAIAVDPTLGVAYAARASARFGLGRYRDAAADYRTALELDPKLATPLYGLAECYRVLGEPRHASEMYQRYADSRAADVREDLRTMAARRAQELR